jgi:hypothetical protein
MPDSGLVGFIVNWPSGKIQNRRAKTERKQGTGMAVSEKRKVGAPWRSLWRIFKGGTKCFRPFTPAGPFFYHKSRIAKI